MEAVGSMGLLLALLGGLALVGLVGGGGSDDDSQDDTPEPDAPEPIIEERDALAGSVFADRLIGSNDIGDISGGGGDDLIIAAGANGVLDGGTGNDGIALNIG